jgi:hypothetical protein
LRLCLAILPVPMLLMGPWAQGVSTAAEAMTIVICNDGAMKTVRAVSDDTGHVPQDCNDCPACILPVLSDPAQTAHVTRPTDWLPAAHRPQVAAVVLSRSARSPVARPPNPCPPVPRMNILRLPLHRLLLSAILALVCLAMLAPLPAAAQTILADLLPDQVASDLVPGAEGFGPDPRRCGRGLGPERGRDDHLGLCHIGFRRHHGLFCKPIHTLIAVDPDAKIAGVRLVKHSKPIVLIGLPEAKVRTLVEGYKGLDLVAEAQSGGTSHDVDIISGATVTVMVIDDSVIRSGLKVARALGLGGLAPEAAATGPRYEIDTTARAPADWSTMEATAPCAA